MGNHENSTLQITLTSSDNEKPNVIGFMENGAIKINNKGSYSPNISIFGVIRIK